MARFDFLIIILYLGLLVMVFRYLNVIRLTKPRIPKFLVNIIATTSAILIVFPPIVGVFYMVERYQSSPPSWETFWNAADHLIGIMLFFIIYVLVSFIIPAVVGMLTVARISERIGLWTFLFFIFLAPMLSALIAYLTKSQNFYELIWINLQYSLFGEAAPTLFSTRWNYELAQSRVRVSTWYINGSQIFHGLGLDLQVSKLIAATLPFISFLADIFGIYMFIDFLASKSKKKEKAG